MSDIPDDIMRLAAKAYGDPFGDDDNAPVNLIIESVARALLSERQRSSSLKALCDEMAKEARLQAFEEAAKIAERLGRHLVRGETGPEYVGGNLDVATAIRSLAKAKEADHG